MALQSPLGQSLLETLGCDEMSINTALGGLDSVILNSTLAELSISQNDVVNRLIEEIQSLEDHDESSPDEPASIILSKSPRGIFAYGTLRADFSPNGDNWGVVSDLRAKGSECVWSYGTVKGFSLYQDPDKFYPFSTPSEEADAVVFGTLLMWPDSDEIFAEAVQKCNPIEGYQYDSPLTGLYKRTIVTVHSKDHGNVEAYLYFQDNKSKLELESSLRFPDSNWLHAQTLCNE